MSNYNDALSTIARFCSTAEHCRHDVLTKVARFELDADEISRLIEYLEKEGYLNEQRYANAFARDKFRFSKWGKIKIRQSLKEKRIHTEMIENAINQIDEKEYLTTLTEILQQKKRSVKANSAYEESAKLVRFAASRGFEPSIALSCIRKAGISHEDIDVFE